MCLSSILSNSLNIIHFSEKTFAINQGKTICYAIDGNHGEANDYVDEKIKGHNFKLVDNINKIKTSSEFDLGLSHLKTLIKTGPKMSKRTSTPFKKVASDHYHLGHEIHVLKFSLRKGICNIIPLNKNEEELDFKISLADPKIKENKNVLISFDLFKSVIKEILAKGNEYISLKFSEFPLVIQYQEAGSIVRAFIAPRINVNEDDNNVSEEEKEGQIVEPTSKDTFDPDSKQEEKEAITGIVEAKDFDNDKSSHSQTEKPSLKKVASQMVEMVRAQVQPTKEAIEDEEEDEDIDLVWSNSKMTWVVPN